tara:strand:- start:1437 stop:1595 length:159 start_codon:yes stop_codon:yes gene_type:complete
MDDFKIKQETDYVKAMDIILAHEDIENLLTLKNYCQHRIKQLEVENEAPAFK